MKKVMMIVQVLGWLVSVIGGLIEELKELLGDNEELMNERLHRLARPEGRATLKAIAKLIVEKGDSLLRHLGATDITIRDQQFVVRDHFKVDTSDTAPAKVSYLGDNFKTWFLEKVEATKSGTSSLRLYELRKDSVDEPIIAEFGGESKAETTLAEMFALMERQKNGEVGVLLNNGYANIFYVRDATGVLRSVDVHWNGDGWDVDADSVEDPRRWRAGRRVFSRNS